jgi:Tfp pilus assembly protein PilN
VRPVNLIPEEDRIGAAKPLRSGPVAYIVVGALVAALLGVTTMVVTSGEIDDLKGEIATVESETAAAEAKASELSPYTQFQSVREQRVATVTSLADSRFDWERVMRELALILPDDVMITALTASASPGTAPSGGASVELRGGIAGPALEMTGCAADQEGVAGFIQAVKDIDGVTRVGVPTSSESGAQGVETDSASSSGGGCDTGLSASFQMVVGFDAAPVAATASEAAPEVAPTSPEAEATVAE